jgi:hypothetical protein
VLWADCIVWQNLLRPEDTGRSSNGGGRQPGGLGRQPGRQPGGLGRQPGGLGRQPGGLGRDKIASEATSKDDTYKAECVRVHTDFRWQTPNLIAAIRTATGVVLMLGSPPGIT